MCVDVLKSCFGFLMEVQVNSLWFSSENQGFPELVVGNIVLMSSFL